MAPLWQPDPERTRHTHLTRFAEVVSAVQDRAVGDYGTLHRWSVEQAPAFWAAIWTYCGVIGERGSRLATDMARMPGARFFPDARLNFAENLLRRRDSALAIVATTESGRDVEMTFEALHAEVVRAAQALRRAGVRKGDRVCGIVSNLPEAIVAALGAAAIGAVWSSVSPDFGVDGIVDRFSQIEPVVLVTVDEYDYGGKRFDCRLKIRDVLARLPTVVETVVVSYDARRKDDGVPGAIPWREWLDRPLERSFEFQPFDFDHPLYILYSSGTTGVPKCIVHGAGGTLLQHLKEHQLHCDVRPGDRVFYFTTCSWMMWHWLVSALASGAALVLYDGSPFHPSPLRLFDLADRVGITLFGVSAKFIDAVRKTGAVPRDSHSLSSVRTITSTGSPLAAESFDFVYSSIKTEVHLASISGGTDIVSCFVLGNPTAPVWRGEIQAPGLGMDVQVFDAAGRPTEEPGELVCATPFPSMPIGFWKDPDGAKYRAAYFERFPGVWHHGDWLQATPHGGYVIYGRSDATLKPSGVRIGTAEIYRQVEAFAEVLESLAVGQRWNADERIVLFVKLADGVTLTDDLRHRISDRLRTHASPWHVPAKIVQVADIPRTRSGKIVELAVRRIIHGEPVPNRDALANPEALDLYRDLPALQS